MLRTLAKTAVVGSVLAFFRRATGRETHYLTSLGLVAIGAVVGASAALLLAPKSGAELRADVRRRAKQLSAGASERIERFRTEKEEDIAEQQHH